MTWSAYGYLGPILPIFPDTFTILFYIAYPLSVQAECTLKVMRTLSDERLKMGPYRKEYLWATSGDK